MDKTDKKIKKYLILLPRLFGGGAERVALQLARHLSEKNQEVLLVYFEEQNNSNPLIFSSGIQLKCLYKKNKWDVLKIIFRVRKILADFKPDTVLSFLFYTNIVTLISSLLLKRSFKLIISERNNPLKYLSLSSFGFIKRLIFHAAYIKADLIISVSKQIKIILTDHFKIPPEKIRVIYNPVSMDEMREKSAIQVQHPFLNPPNKFLIMAAGRLNPQKRFDLLLRAFSRVRPTHDHVYLIILGEGPLLEELKSLSSQLKISPWVDFRGYQSNPYSWISKADLFVLTSDFEGFPNVVIEAMGLGIPVIATDCPSGPNEIITDNENGILTPVGDELILSQKIISLLKDTALRKKISEKGLERANDFRKEIILPEYEEVLNEYDTKRTR